MEKLLIDTCVNFFISMSSSIVSKIKDKNNWNIVVKKASSTLPLTRDYDEDTIESISNIFTKDNLEKVSKSLKTRSIYDFKSVIYDSIFNIFLANNFSKNEASLLTNDYIKIILNELEKEKPEDSLKVYLSLWKETNENNYNLLIKELELIKTYLKDLNKEKYYLINDIDYKIKISTQEPSLNLDFFQLNDNKFKETFENQLTTFQNIYVIGNSKEETLFRLLNELRTLFNNDNYNFDAVLIITSKEDWTKLSNKNISNKVLIPFFYSDSIIPIENNINIFIYNNINEECLNPNKIQLRRRTRRNIIESLEKTGREHKDVDKLFKKTNGLYWPLKNQLFLGKIGKSPLWKTKLNRNLAKALLLCGKWTDSEKDINIIKELSGFTDDKEIYTQIAPFINGENPFILKTNNLYKIADIEYAWEVLDNEITISDWKTFLEYLKIVLKEQKQNFDSFTENIEIYGVSENSQSEWSYPLKKGLLNSLIMRVIHKQHEEDQQSIDSTILDIFSSVDTKEKWANISLFMKEIAEASPTIFLSQIEKQLKDSTGMLNIFSGNTSNSTFYVGTTYTKILWAIEQLLLQKQYVSQAIKILWELNEKKIEYNFDNSPRSVLENIFCAWINTSVITVEEKIHFAKNAFKTYKNVWNIFYALLPNKKLSIFGEFNEPNYRKIDEKTPLNSAEVSKTYIEYFNLCFTNMDDNIDKWIALIEEVDLYPINIIMNFLNRVEQYISNKADSDKYKLSNSLREIIYKHRFFVNSNWSMSEEKIKLFEKTLLNITYREQIYYFLYYFTTWYYEMNLLNPIPYNEENNQDLNLEKEKKRRKEEFSKFKKEQLSLNSLIQIAKINENCNLQSLGKNISNYYDRNKFNENTLNILMKSNEFSIVYNYIREMYLQNDYNQDILKNSLTSIRPKLNNLEIVEVFLLEIIDNTSDTLINYESKEIKKFYWQKFNRIVIHSNKKAIIWALEECKQYGSLPTYINILYETLTILPIEQILEYTLKIKSFFSSKELVDNYCLTKILAILFESFKDKHKICEELARIELFFSSNLKWEQMNFLKHNMKDSPKFYTHIIKHIYINDDGATAVNTEEQYEKIKNYYNLYLRINFCPKEFEGRVDYLEIKKWVSEFKQLLISQNQESLFGKLLGDLLPFAPTEVETIAPCESVRKIIEENFDSSLFNSYIITEKNKRGVYTPDAGESETKIAKNYLKVAQKYYVSSPKTAEIFSALSKSYDFQSKKERKDAENGHLYE